MTELQGIGAGIDVPYELLSGDLSNVNYSSYRAGMLGFRNAIEAFRWLTLIPMYCRPTWRRFIDTLVFIGKIPEANYGVQWTAPKFESVDPLKDAMAELKRIRTGTLTLSEAIAQNGYDPEKQLQEIKRMNDLLDELQIILDCDPRKVNDKGVEQPTVSGEAAPAPPAKRDRHSEAFRPAVGFAHQKLHLVNRQLQEGVLHARRNHGDSAGDRPGRRSSLPRRSPRASRNPAEFGEVERFTVAATFAPPSANDDARTIDAVWYTGAKVPRFDWRTGEEYDLILDMKGCRMDRLNNGGPVLDSHSRVRRRESTGRGAQGVGRRSATGMATIQFSKRDAVTPIWNDVQGGIIQNLSPGMWIYKKVDTTPKGQERREFTATDWEPFEISLVPVPADAATTFMSAAERATGATECS